MECLEPYYHASVLASQNYVLSTLPRMSELSESFLGLVLRNLNKFLYFVKAKFCF